MRCWQDLSVLVVQCREEEGGPFVESMLGSGSSGQSSSRRPFMRRQDVALPPDKGWQWTDDWQVQSNIVCHCLSFRCTI